jgi:zinc and cadmium transporter
VAFSFAMTMQFWWIFISGLMMSSIALVGSVTLFLSEKTLSKIISPLVALSAGSLLGGAFFHMLPETIEKSGNNLNIYVWLMAGFFLFLFLEQFLHWQHSHNPNLKQPLTYMILVADGLHNFIGGLGVASAFIMDFRVGLVTWIAAAAHEIPQELGDFGILIHGGWERKKALLFNFLSALTFLIGGLVTYFVSFHLNLDFLVPFAAGNFIYIAASDLIPEIKQHIGLKTNAIHLFFVLLGLVVLYGIKVFSS